MMFRNSVLLSRIFDVFDTDKDGFINFREFVNCLSTMCSKATHEEKLKCKWIFRSINFCNRNFLVSFSIYDSNCDGMISPEELKTTVLALMNEQYIIMSSDEATKIVERTMHDLHLTMNDHISIEK